LAQFDWIWDLIRPVYDRAVCVAGRSGLERVINETDHILIAPKFRSLNETYEPEMWQSLMNELRPADVFVDVGVYIGLYTVAVGKRLGVAGRVYGFEPDPANYKHALRHVELNSLSNRVKLVHAAVGERNERVHFKFAAEVGHIVSASESGTSAVDCVTLDQVFVGKKVDLLKIDVEGYEEMVLAGGRTLLKDITRCPRAIYIEVHPYAWPNVGTTSDSLLGLLNDSGYSVTTLQNEPVTRIESYGEIIASKNTRP
jgi:FkbM family methyltransferase